MFNDDAGPLKLMAIDELRTLPFRPSFSGLVANSLAALPGADAQLGAQQFSARANSGDPNDGFEGEIAAAIGDGLLPPGDGISLDTGESISRGDNLDAVRQSVAGVLPGADAPIDLSFESPPTPPHIDIAQAAHDKYEPDQEPTQS